MQEDVSLHYGLSAGSLPSAGNAARYDIVLHAMYV